VKTQGALAAFSLIVLSACSNSPSDSEVKKAVVGGLKITNCRNFSIDNFEKVNGIAHPDGRHYQVAVKYTLKVSPLSDAKGLQDELTASHANEDLLLKQAQEKYREFKIARQSEPKEDFSKNQFIDMDLSREVSNAEAVISGRKTSDGAILLKRYSDGCSTESGFMWGFISELYAGDKNWITNGIAKEITDTIELGSVDNQASHMTAAVSATKEAKRSASLS
jgi:hypothetical protein